MTRRLPSKKSSRCAAVKSRLDFPVTDAGVHVNDYTPTLRRIAAAARRSMRCACRWAGGSRPMAPGAPRAGR